MFKSRPFVSRSQAAEKTLSTGTYTAWRRAARNGHRLDGGSSINTPIPVEGARIFQAQLSNEQSGEPKDREIEQQVTMQKPNYAFPSDPSTFRQSIIHWPYRKTAGQKSTGVNPTPALQSDKTADHQDTPSIYTVIRQSVKRQTQEIGRQSDSNQPRQNPLTLGPIQRADAEEEHNFPTIDQVFNPGDKLYGPRLNRLRAQGAVLDRAEGHATVIDQLNNQFVGTEGAGLVSRTMGSLARQSGLNNQQREEVERWKALARYGAPKPGENPTPEQEQEATEFRKFLEQHPKYSPNRWRTVRKRSRKSPFRQHERIKKACKAGIEFALQRQKKVHFFIDDLDQDAVINKMDYLTHEPEVMIHPITGDSKQSITASELRYLYRHWQDPVFQQGVSFWQNGRQVPPPWQTNAEAWNNYHPTHRYNG